MKTLQLNLKKKWFDMIISGEKKEEYREIKDYWSSRFIAFLWSENINSKSHVESLKTNDYTEICWNEYDTITFSNGYSKNRPQFKIELKGFEVATGKKEWGADPGIEYFVLKLGEILESNQLNNK